MTEVSANINKYKETPYADFWYRFGAIFLDGIFLVPVTILIMYLDSISINANYFTIFLNLVFMFFYHTYCVKRFGGTPGKLVVGIKVVKLNGNNVGWREAVLRELIVYIVVLLGIISTLIALGKANPLYYERLSWLEQTQYLNSFVPDLMRVQVWVSNIWVYSELVVLLTNKKRRAIHDFIAGTIVIMKVYQQRVIDEESDTDTQAVE